MTRLQMETTLAALGDDRRPRPKHAWSVLAGSRRILAVACDVVNEPLSLR